MSWNSTLLILVSSLAVAGDAGSFELGARVGVARSEMRGTLPMVPTAQVQSIVFGPSLRVPGWRGLFLGVDAIYLRKGGSTADGFWDWGHEQFGNYIITMESHVLEISGMVSIPIRIRLPTIDATVGPTVGVLLDSKFRHDAPSYLAPIHEEFLRRPSRFDPGLSLGIAIGTRTRGLSTYFDVRYVGGLRNVYEPGSGIEGRNQSISLAVTARR